MGSEWWYVMALSAFVGNSRPPQDEELAAVLGSTFILWNDLISRMSSRFAPMTIEWKHTSKSTGWGVRLKTAKRAVLYMTPCNGYFLASFALEVIEGARMYAEGRGVRLEVRGAGDVRSIEKLADIKMAN